MDKLIGAELFAGRIPLAGRVLLVSGRVSFGAGPEGGDRRSSRTGSRRRPSSLAVDLARESGMTLLGFVRDARFNVYSDFGRIDSTDFLTHSA